MARDRRPAQPGGDEARSSPLLIIPFAWALTFGSPGASKGAELPACPTATPQQTLAPLYQVVEASGLYPDSKTFADAAPLLPPQEILRRFEKAGPTSREALAAFLHPLFAMPSPTPDSPSRSPAASPRVPGAARRSLSAHIQDLWPALARSDPAVGDASSRLSLPRPYVVPGGRFEELYYWDSYFTLLGLKADRRQDLVESMIEDFGSLIERFGHVPNGARSYYLSRSQPPLFYAMTALSPDRRQITRRRRLGWMRQEHAYWMAGSWGLRRGERRGHVARLLSGEIVNRYHDACATPRDESWAEDVRLSARSQRPAAELYVELRSAAESGWDFSSRWMGDPADLATLRITSLAPVDLNSLMFGLEARIASECRRLGDAACAERYAKLAHRRRRALNERFWDPAAGVYRDYDLVTDQRTGSLTAASLYPLFVGAADRARARRVARAAGRWLLAPGGLRTTTEVSGQQWDRPNGWAPLQWIAVEGLRRYGQVRLAAAIRARFLASVRREYVASGRLVEKYDIDSGRPGGGGEYPLQDGFGWTNGVVEAWLKGGGE